MGGKAESGPFWSLCRLGKLRRLLLEMAAWHRGSDDALFLVDQMGFHRSGVVVTVGNGLVASGGLVHYLPERWEQLWSPCCVCHLDVCQACWHSWAASVMVCVKGMSCSGVRMESPSGSVG